MDKVPCDTCGGLVELSGKSTSVNMCNVCYSSIVSYELQCEKEENEFTERIEEGTG